MDTPQRQRTSRVGRRCKALMIGALAVGTLGAGGAIATTTADRGDESAGGFLCYTVDAYGRVNRLCGAVPLYYIPY